ncbi:MAG TPA: hypothetical protein VET48_04925 [Steroidobacteraceae bacterium]|nr:hypothetical protein [Steroidobacteraceae bacterium]
MRKFLLSLILVACPLLFLGPSAQAAGVTANVVWTNPTTYNSGETLAASDILQYTICWTRNVTTITGGCITVPAPASSSPVTGFPCGSEAFVVTLTTTPTALHPNTISDPGISGRYNTGISCNNNPGAISGVGAS